MSVPTEQQPISPPPPFLDQQQQEATDRSHQGSSVGPVIAVLFVITFLGVVAGMIGRLFTGRGLFGHWEYDLEAWVETKCASCIDGHVVHDPVPTRRIHIPVPDPVGTQHQEEEDQEDATREEEEKEEEEEEGGGEEEEENGQITAGQGAPQEQVEDGAKEPPQKRVPQESTSPG